MAFPVSEERIADAEAKIGRKLPESYRHRLMRDNGGEAQALGFEWQVHPVWDPSDKKRIKRTANHVLKETDSARDWYGFPNEAVAIAHDGCGNLLISRSEADLIEFWDHETGECEPVEVDWS